jgi:hypothetical protein
MSCENLEASWPVRGWVSCLFILSSAVNVHINLFSVECVIDGWLCSWKETKCWEHLWGPSHCTSFMENARELFRAQINTTRLDSWGSKAQLYRPVYKQSLVTLNTASLFSRVCKYCRIPGHSVCHCIVFLYIATSLSFNMLSSRI